MKQAFAFAFLLCLTAIRGFTQNHEVDSLVRLLPSTPTEKKIDVYQEIVIRLWLNHPDSAMQFAREAMRLAKRTDDVRTKAIAHRLLGGVHYYKGSYDSTIKYSYDAYAFSRLTNDSTLMTSAMNNIGLAYYNMASYTEALEYLLRALNLKTKIRQEYGYAQTLNNIGLVYTELKDYEKARQYFQDAKAYAISKGDKNQHLYSLNNIGNTYLQQEMFDDAATYFYRALDIAETIDNTNWHAVTFSGLAQIHYENFDLDRATQLFRKSLALRQKISDLSGIAEVYSFLGSIQTREGHTDSARYYLGRSLSIARQTHDKDLTMFNFELLKDMFVKDKAFDSALYYQSKFMAIRDSVYNDNLARNIKSIQLQIEREEAQTKLADKDDQIRKITTQTYLLIGLVVLLIAGSVILYRAYKEHRRLTSDLVKTNKEITAQKEEIHQHRDKLALSHAELEMAKEIITAKNVELSKLNWQLQNTVDRRTQELDRANQELKVVNLELENFIYRSSHDIRGPLVRLLGICHVALLDVHESRAREYFNMLFESAQQLNDIFDRLKIVSHINETSITPVRINFDTILNQVLDRLKTMDGFNEVEIERENLANEWNSDPFLLELVLLNMIENSIRFQKKSTQERKFVKIKTARNGKHVKVEIIDNGIGIKDSVTQDLYQMFSKAARDNRNIGLGLYIVKQALNKLNGSINLVKNGEGYTQFEVLHPIVN